MLTGVRGVGKTTTARILARGLNYAAAGRHAPARRSRCRRSACTARRSWKCATSTCWRWTPPRIPASTTCARSPTACATRRSRRRYKVYIIDEVHMLSDKRLQRLPEDARGAAAARQVRLRDDRDPQGPGHHPVALPALRPAPRRGRHARRASRQTICGLEGVAAEPEALAADRAGGRRLGARRALAPRPGHRPRRRRGHGRGRCATCSASPTARRVIDLFEAVMRGDVPAAFAELARPIRRRRRPGA